MEAVVPSNGAAREVPAAATAKAAAVMEEGNAGAAGLKTLGSNSVLLTGGIIIADFVGAGILAMPSAMADFGWLLGSILIVVLLLMNLHISILMWRVRMHCQDAHTYVDLARSAFELAPLWQRRVAVGCTATSQYVFLFVLLGIYLLSAGKGLGMLFYSVPVCLPIWTLIGAAMLLPFNGSARQMGSWQSLIYLNVLSLLGSIFIPLCYMVFTGVEEVRPADSQVFAVSSLTPSNTLSGFSAMAFAFTGQFMLTEIISEMKEPERLPAAYGLVASPFMLVAYLLVGIVGYCYVGDSIQGTIVELLPFGGLLQAAGTCLVLHMLIAYLIKGVVFCQAVQRAVDHEHSAHDDKSPRSWASWNVVVVLVLGSAYMLANLVPFFNDLVELLGASCTPLSCWIIPIVMFARWYRDAPAKVRGHVGMTEWAIIAIELIVAFVLMVFGTYTAVGNIIEHWHTYGYPFECHCEQIWNTCACSATHVGMEEVCLLNATTVG